MIAGVHPRSAQFYVLRHRKSLARYMPSFDVSMRLNALARTCVQLMLALRESARSILHGRNYTRDIHACVYSPVPKNGNGEIKMKREYVRGTFFDAYLIYSINQLGDAVDVIRGSRCSE